MNIKCFRITLGLSFLRNGKGFDNVCGCTFREKLPEEVESEELGRQLLEDVRKQAQNDNSKKLISLFGRSWQHCL